MSFDLSISQKLTQGLALNPQLQQAIKILALNNLELNAEIQEYLNSNPLLEVQEDIEVITADEKFKKSAKSEDWENVSLNNLDDDYKEYLFDQYSKNKFDFFSEMIQQSAYFNLSQKNKAIFISLVGNLNSSGFLDEKIENIAANLNTNIESIEKVLRVLQSIEPVGIGSRNVREFLLIQLENIGQQNSLAYKLVEDYLDEIANQNLHKIAKILNVSNDEVFAAYTFIQSLRKRPLTENIDSETDYIIPDLFLIKEKDSWKVMLNEDSLPNISVSPYYLNLINNNLFNDRYEKKFFLKKFKEAGWFLKALYQRANTIKRVGEYIFKHQADFIEKGIDGLKPLNLKKVAEELELHESTISRAANNKFIETPRGIYPLKCFFVSKIQSKNQNGEDEDISINNLKAKILDLIKNEDPKSPLSDQKITDILLANKINIARRTVSKYREEMSIPSTKIRKLSSSSAS